MGFALGAEPTIEAVKALPKADLLRLLGAILAGQVDPRALPALYWPQLAAAAQQHGLGALLLQRAGAAGSRPDLATALAALRQARSQDAVQYMLMVQTLREVQAALDAADIQCIWLKGIVLAHTVYPQPELRPMVDLDLLAPYGQRDAARRALETLGLELAQQLFDGTEDLKHHYCLVNRMPGRAPVEVHFRLLGVGERLLSLRQVEWFWTQTQPWACGGHSYPGLRPEAHFLYVAAHALLQHGEADLRLQRFYDLHALLTESPAFDWSVAVDGAVALGWTFAVARALWLTRHFFATPIPDAVLVELAARPAHRDAVYVRQRQQRRATTQVVLDDLALLAWPDRVRTAVRIIAPPVDYMCWRYQVTTPWRLPLAYGTRWLGMGIDALRMLERRRQRRG